MGDKNSIKAGYRAVLIEESSPILNSLVELKRIKRHGSRANSPKIQRITAYAESIKAIERKLIVDANSSTQCEEATKNIESPNNLFLAINLRSNWHAYNKA